MNTKKRKKSQLSDQESQILTDELDALDQGTLDFPDTDRSGPDEAQEKSEELIEFARDPSTNLYGLAEEVDAFSDNDYHSLLGFSSWEDWSEENSLPTKTIARHLKIFRQLTERRRIPIEEYKHLTPGQVEAVLRPLLVDEPKVIAIAIENCYHPYPELDKWYEWEDELLARLKAG